MIAIPSEIKLENFAVLQSHYEFNQPKRNPRDPRKLFNSYEIDIDFAHQLNDDNTMQVFTKISVNHRKGFARLPVACGRSSFIFPG
jgi:hypothetical protein